MSGMKCFRHSLGLKILYILHKGNGSHRTEILFSVSHMNKTEMLQFRAEVQYNVKLHFSSAQSSC